MGFLDSIFKKNKETDGGVDEEVRSPSNPLGKEALIFKLKGFLNHLEKIILGMVLVGVATVSILKFIETKKELDVLSAADTTVALRGEKLDLGEISPTNLAKLVEKSVKTPDSINLSGSNHLVFNPRVWKEFFMTNLGEVKMIKDSPDEPLGISALTVSGIYTNRSRVTARAFLGGGFVRYEFKSEDYEYPAVPYSVMRVPAALNPIKTFLPQQPMNQSYGALLTALYRGWTPDPDPLKPPKSLHGFVGANAYWLRFHPEWELLVKFNSVDRATPGQVALAQRDPQQTVPQVVFNVDLVRGTKSGSGIHPYETNSVQLLSGVPHEEIRGYVANFVYETKYHNRTELKGFREGRHLMIDGEVFRVFRIMPNSVSLVSDPLYGGNGKIYDKPFRPGIAPVGP